MKNVSTHTVEGEISHGDQNHLLYQAVNMFISALRVATFCTNTLASFFSLERLLLGYISSYVSMVVCKLIG